MESLNKYANNIITFLVIAALVLGYVLLINGNPKTEINKRGNELATPGSAEVLITPPPNASDEEKKRHLETAISLAKEADYLNISNCFGSPAVLKIKVGDPLKINNPDQTDHTIVFNEKKQYFVKAGETKTISGVFENGPGLYGYGCDLSPTTAGLFLVTPE